MNGARLGPPWYHGWNVIAACVVAQMAALGVTINCFSLFLPQWTREFGVPVSELAFAVTLFSIGTAAFSYLIGVSASRYPARWLFGIGLTLLAVCLLLIARAQGPGRIIAVYVFLMPIAIGLSGSIPAQSLVSRWFSRRAGLALGLTAFGLALAGVLFPPVIVHLLPQVGWRVIWTGMAVLVIALVIPIVLAVMRDRPDPDDRSIYARPAEGHAAGMPVLTLGGIVRRRNFWVILGAFLSGQLISMTVAVDIAPIVSSYGGDTAAAGLFLSVFNLSALAAKLGSGWLADRIGSGTPLAMVAAAGGCGAMLLAVPEAHPIHLAGAALLTGLVGGGWTLLASSMLSEFGPGSFSRAFGLACALSPIGTFAPPIVARLQEASGSFVAPLLTLGGMALVAAGGVIVLYRRPALRVAATHA